MLGVLQRGIGEEVESNDEIRGRSQVTEIILSGDGLKWQKAGHTSDTLQTKENRKKQRQITTTILQVARTTSAIRKPNTGMNGKEWEWPIAKKWMRDISVFLEKLLISAFFDVFVDNPVHLCSTVNKKTGRLWPSLYAVATARCSSIHGRRFTCQFLNRFRRDIHSWYNGFPCTW